MREKLIELIGYVQYLGGLELALADHLIANGVTIPVRCKDCSVWKRREDGLINCPYCSDLKEDDDFCSYGERRTDG